MSDYISNATANFTGTVWALADAGSNATQSTRSASTASTTSFVYSSAFTITNTDVVDGLLLFCYGTAGGTGTVTVSLYDGTTDLKTVTLNISDLPQGSTNGGWIFFKFGSSYTSTGLATMKVGIKTSTTGTATFYRDGTAGNWTRLVRRTTTGTPVAADNMYIVGEWTAAATVTTNTVTMNNTATTAFGKFDIGSYGVLTWGVTASTAYYLKTAGIFEIWANGTMNMGTVGTPMPSTSTAELEFVNASNVDRGLEIRGYGTFNSYGTTKVLKAKILSTPITITNKVIASSVATLTSSSAHGLLTGDSVDVNISDYNFDGTYTLTGAPTTTTFTYSTSTSTFATAAATGSASKNAKSGQAIVIIDNASHGWTNGDTLGVSSTSRTASESEKVTYSSSSGATITLTGNLTNTHTGLSPYQGDVVNLTQNVKIHGTSTSLQCYINVSDYGLINCNYTWFYWMGSGTSSKRGIDYQNTQSVGNSYLNYCSFMDFSVTSAICINTATNAANLTVDNCVLYGVATLTAAILVGTTTATLVFSNNVIISNGQWAYGFSLSDIGATLTGNIIAGCLQGINISESSVAMGTHTSNVVHSCSSGGVIVNAAPFGINATTSTFTSMNLWRNGSYGFALNNGITSFNVAFNSCTFTGNSSQGVYIQSPVVDYYFKSCVFDAGNISWSQGSGLIVASSIYIIRMTVSDTTFGYPHAHTSSDFNFNSTYPLVGLNFHNCLLNSTSGFITQSNLITGLPVGFMTYGQTVNNHKAYLKYGVISYDSGIADISPSERLTPNSATNKLQGSSKFCTIEASGTRTITVKTRQSIAGDGTAYNGAYQRLIVKANPSIGIYTDTVIATATSSSAGAFEALTVVSPTATLKGIMELCIDCDGTTGWVNVDSWSVI